MPEALAEEKQDGPQQQQLPPAAIALVGGELIIAVEGGRHSGVRTSQHNDNKQEGAKNGWSMCVSWSNRCHAPCMNRDAFVIPGAAAAAQQQQQQQILLSAPDTMMCTAPGQNRSPIR